MRLGLMSVALCMAVTAALPVAAQKSKDTLRLGLNDPFVILSPYQGGGDEASNFTRGVYETLLVFDERNKKWVPSLGSRLSSRVRAPCRQASTAGDPVHGPREREVQFG